MLSYRSFLGKPLLKNNLVKVSNSRCREKLSELILYARWSKVKILLSLKLRGTKLKKLSPSPVKVGLRYTDVVSLVGSLVTWQSRNGKQLFNSDSEVNFRLACLPFIYLRNLGRWVLHLKMTKQSSIYRR